MIHAKPTDWHEVVPIGLRSHMGKHAFLLLTVADGTVRQLDDLLQVPQRLP